MAVIYARIRVADVERWHAAFLEAAPIRREHGITTRAIYKDSTYHDGLIVVLNAEDLETAEEFYHSDEQLRRMARSGIERPAEMWMGTPLELAVPAT
jgi:hypothetical protein